MLVKEKDRKNNYKNLKKYKDKKIFLETDVNDDEEKIFIKVFNEKNIRKRYELIYDYTWEYLDKNVCILCDFKCDKCISNRLNKSVHNVNGCCCFNNKKCEFLKDNKCIRHNITCKLFMCSYIENKVLKKKSVSKNYLLLNYFLNNKQKKILKSSFKVLKQDIIDELIKNK